MKRFRIGHTAITWGYEVDRIDQAVRDIAAVGYMGIETFGDTIAAYNRHHPEGFSSLLNAHGLPLASVFCPVWATEPGQAGESIAQVTEWAVLARDLGASTIVIQGGKRGPGQYQNYPFLVNLFNEIGRRSVDMGLAVAVHPHTGTVIETREEIDIVLTAVDHHLVGFAPDTGHLARGGSEVLRVLQDYRSIIRHVHLKDYEGGPAAFDEDGREIDSSGYSGYLPLGQGKTDYQAVFHLLDEVHYNGWVMVELNPPTRDVPYSPIEAARRSRHYLEQEFGQRFTI